MKRLRDNRTLRPAGWVLFAAAVCAALLLGQQFLFALWYTQFGDWTTTWAFDTNLNQRAYQVQDYVQLQTDLDSGSLDYVEREQTVTLLAATREALSPERTNFRYQILSADGAQVLDTNLQDSSQSFETQVTGVYYGGPQRPGGLYRQVGAVDRLHDSLLQRRRSGTVGGQPKQRHSALRRAQAGADGGPG